MRESRSSSETKFQLTTVDNPDLPEIDKPVLTFKGRPENGKSYQQTNSAIVTAWLGIILAGGLCPCLILIFGFAVRLTRSGLPSSYAGQFLFSWLETVFLSTIIGMLLVAFCCAFSSAVIVLLNWTELSQAKAIVPTWSCGQLTAVRLFQNLVITPNRKHDDEQQRRAHKNDCQRRHAVLPGPVKAPAESSGASLPSISMPADRQRREPIAVTIISMAIVPRITSHA